MDYKRLFAMGLFGYSLVYAQTSVGPLLVTSQVKPGFDLRGKALPKWSAGALVVLANDNSAAPAVTVLGRDGKTIETIPFTVPGASVVSIRDVARAVDGTIALVGSATDTAGRVASFVARASNAGQDTQVIRTNPYIPFRVAIASDATIWTAGYEYRDPLPAGAQKMRDKLNLNAGVFRRFDKEGKQIASLVSQSEITDPLTLRSGLPIFGASGNRIVWYSARASQYIEISADGTTSTISGLTLPAGGRENGAAFTETGNVFVAAVGGGQWSVAKLDRSHRVWVPVVQNQIAPGHPPIVLYGADGDALVGTTDVANMQFYANAN